MKSPHLFLGIAPSAALAGLLACVAVPAAAQTQPAFSAPPAYAGLDCSRCAAGAQFCVINVMRFEYACAPIGTYACAGFSGTSYCRYGTMCWDGACR